MGNSQSKDEHNSKVLYELSTSEISNYVTNLGKKYEAYGSSIDSNAVDGELLMEIEDIDEFKEAILECLDITNFLHQKVLIKEWKKAKTIANGRSASNKAASKVGGVVLQPQTQQPMATPPPPPVTTGIHRSETTYTVATDDSDITMDSTSRFDAARSRSASSSASSTTSTSSSNSSSSDYCRPIMDDSQRVDTAVEAQVPAEKTASNALALSPPPVPPTPSEAEALPSSRTPPSETAPLTMSLRQKERLVSFDLPKSTDQLPADDPTLQPFHRMATQVLEDLGGSFAQVNLLDCSVGPGVVDQKGVNNLSTVTPATSSENLRMHFDSPNDHEICRRFILGSNEEFHIEDIPLEVSKAVGMQGSAKYYGHVVQYGSGLRIGTICTIIEDSVAKFTTSQQKQEILQFLATLVKGQLEKREALLQRSLNLKEDLRNIYQQGIDPILAPPLGPIRAVTASQVAQRHTLFPYPTTQDEHQDQHAAAENHPNGFPTQPEFTRRSATLPFLQEQNATMAAATVTPRSIQEDSASSPSSMTAHLPLSYFDNVAFQKTTENQYPMDLTPITTSDMERAAHLQSLQLLQMDPLSQEAQSIQGLVELAATLLHGVDFAFVNLLTNQHCNLFFMTSDCNAKQPWPEIESFLRTGFQADAIRNHPSTGKAFHLQGERCTNVCNYVLATPHQQSFVVHDMAKDQSVAGIFHNGGPGFYSGSPIVVEGTTVGCLCCVSQQPNPKYGQIQELQQEQFAHLIAQQYETWSLHREVQQLERGRDLFMRTNQTTASLSSSSSSSSTSTMGIAAPPPTTATPAAATTTSNINRCSSGGSISCCTSLPPAEDYGALVFTSLQDITRGPGGQTMKRAIELHNQIVRSNIVESGGSEVAPAKYSGAFIVAFSDVVDAVQFCLETQEAIHAAPWESDLLTTKKDYIGAFRGLRVKMAIHYGKVEINDASGSPQEVDCLDGETFHIVKNLVSMAHGGQILITSDVWNVASHSATSELRSPQVLDLGSHVVPTRSSNMCDGVATKSILQLVPASLAHDFCANRKLGGEVSMSCPSGRTFPRIKTRKSVSSSFHDAPFAENHVVLVQMDTSEIERTPVADSGLLLAALSKRIGAILREQQDGYQCSNLTVAFDEVAAAVRFGLAVQENLAEEAVLDVSLRDKVRIGVHEGVFDTMGPNPVTGRAEYFGSVVDTAALVARSASLGCVLMGKKTEGMDEYNLLPITNGFMLDFTGRKYFEAVQEELTLYKCCPCKSWYDQMVDRRSGRTSLQSPWKGH